MAPSESPNGLARSGRAQVFHSGEVPSVVEAESRSFSPTQSSPGEPERCWKASRRFGSRPRLIVQLCPHQANAPTPSWEWAQKVAKESLAQEMRGDGEVEHFMSVKLPIRGSSHEPQWKLASTGDATLRRLLSQLVMMPAALEAPSSLELAHVTHR